MRAKKTRSAAPEVERRVRLPAVSPGGQIGKLNWDIAHLHLQRHRTADPRLVLR